MTILPNGNVGLGITTPRANLHVTDGTTGTIAFPYETAVIERNGDFKFGIFNTTLTPNNSAISINLGYSRFTNTNNVHPGFELQYGIWDNVPIFRLNSLSRNPLTGEFNGANTFQNIMAISNNGMVGVNLNGGVPGPPLVPTANLDVNGTVRFRNLPNGGGSYLVVDANGNVRRSASTIAARQAISTSNIEEIDALKKEINVLKKQFQDLVSLVNKYSTGNNREPNSKQFQLFPNPAIETLNIIPITSPSNTNKRVDIINSNGKTIKTHYFVNNHSIPLKGLSAGIYLINIIEGNKLVHSEKVIISQ